MEMANQQEARLEQLFGAIKAFESCSCEEILHQNSFAMLSEITISNDERM